MFREWCVYGDVLRPRWLNVIPLTVRWLMLAAVLLGISRGNGWRTLEHVQVRLCSWYASGRLVGAALLPPPPPTFVYENRGFLEEPLHPSLRAQAEKETAYRPADAESNQKRFELNVSATEAGVAEVSASGGSFGGYDAFTVRLYCKTLSGDARSYLWSRC